MRTSRHVVSLRPRLEARPPGRSAGTLPGVTLGGFALSEIDTAIVEALQVDGRQPYTALAERLGISEAHVRRRVRALLDADVIAVTAIADPRVFGLNAMAWIGLVVAHEHLERIQRLLLEQPELDYLVVTSGRFNLMVEAACADADTLYELLRRLRAIPGVRRTETFFYLRLLQQRFQWIRADGDAGGVERVVVPAELDPLDLRLVRALQENGRASFRELAQTLEVSERALSARYTQLVEKKAIHVSAVVNPISLGFRAIAWAGFNLYESADFDRVMAELSAQPEISYLVATSGRYDGMVELVCRDAEELLDTLTNRLGRVRGIADVETFYYLRLHYRSTAGAWSAARSLAQS